jgi:hypothetical protein
MVERVGKHELLMRLWRLNCRKGDPGKLLIGRTLDTAFLL